mgnify:CR=1 FL=1
MPGIDETRPFLPVNIAVLTISDSRTLADDKSGDRLVEMITRDGHKVAKRAIVTDDADRIVAALKDLADDAEIDCVITTGGTGVTGRDVTPEAFKQVMEKEIEGFGELFRMLSYQKVGTSTMQSRAIGGVAGNRDHARRHRAQACQQLPRHAPLLVLADDRRHAEALVGVDRDREVGLRGAHVGQRDAEVGLRGLQLPARMVVQHHAPLGTL